MSRGRGGRGGRGRGPSFGNLEALNLPPGPPPPPTLQPPQLFPVLERRALPLMATDLHDYLATIKQEFRANSLQSHFYLKESTHKRDVERYSDRYKNVKRNGVDDGLDWEPVWSFFPKELQNLKGKNRRKSSGEQPKYKPIVRTRAESDKKKDAKKVKKQDSPESEVNEELDETPARKRVKFSPTTSDEPIAKRLEILEKKESTTGNESPKEEEEAVSEEEYYDEEIEEEGTDYNLTYFDNGEDYGGEDDEPLEDKDGAYY